MEPTLLMWLFQEHRPTPLDGSDGLQAQLLITPDRTGDSGRYLVDIRKLVDGPRGVPGFLRRGKCSPAPWFEVRLYRDTSCPGLLTIICGGPSRKRPTVPDMQRVCPAYSSSGGVSNFNRSAGKITTRSISWLG